MATPLKILLVVPPFEVPNRPHLDCHQLQACAREAGFEVDIRYANLLLARAIGEPRYERTYGWSSRDEFFFERLFAPGAFGVTASRGSAGIPGSPCFLADLSDEEFLDLVAECEKLTREIASWIVGEGYDLVGCSSPFTSASLAILREVKSLSAGTIAWMGGPSCAGETAAGILGLAPWLDYVFSGESESVFVEFLEKVASGRSPSAHSVVTGRPYPDLDRLPLPDFAQYYDQLRSVLPDTRHLEAGSVLLPYRSSRGCWWAQDRHCTFCGQVGDDVAWREKTPHKVLADLKLLLRAHPGRQVTMSDPIMPAGYVSSLLPALERELPGITIVYPQRADLDLDQVVALKNAGATVMPVGVESLSTPLLDLLNRGTTASRNLRLLRYAQSSGIKPLWSLLWGLPGDRVDWYEAMHSLLTRIHHLQPPTGLFDLSIDRFSPYLRRPDHFGIENVRPREEYREFLPAGADIARIARSFCGDYHSESAANPQIAAKIRDEIALWTQQWSRSDAAQPVLLVEELPDGRIALFDTRDLSGPGARFLDEDEARIVLAGASCYRPDDALHRWAVAGSYCVKLDGALEPVAIAAPELLARFESGDQAVDVAAGEVSIDEKGFVRVANDGLAKFIERMGAMARARARQEAGEVVSIQLPNHEQVCFVTRPETSR